MNFLASDYHFEITEDTSGESCLKRIESLESAQTFSLITVDASVAAWDTCRQCLARIRSANLPAMLRIKKGDWICELAETGYLLKALRDWDQLTLHNLLELLKEYLPQESRVCLESESKIEMKSFQEWMVAANDPRIHQYPTLPWRSFIRKVVAENYEFASDTLDILYMVGADAEHSPELKTLLDSFLNSKKKVLCLFPKRWKKT